MTGAGEATARLARNPRLARWVGFWWGLAEGVFFFIVPDVYISFAALFSLSAGALAWLASIAGSVVAIGVIFLLMATAGPAYLTFLDAIPGISGSLIARVGRELASDGLPYTPLLVLGGVPLKVYGAQAFSLGLPLGSVLLWTVFARVARIAPTFVLVSAVRALLRRRIDARPTRWAVLLGVFWIAFYAFYFRRMSGI